MSEQVIRQVLAEHAHLSTSIEQLADSSDLYEAGMTSHASVNVMLGLEDAFDIEFPERLLRKSTFASIANIQAALAELDA